MARPGPAGRRVATVAAASGLLLLAAAAAPAQWTTARGNAERTGNVDGQAGPKQPKVVWAHKAAEHFIGAPAVADGTLYVPTLGAFNTGTFHALSLERDAPQRVRWSKAAPFVKRPTVCSPAVAEGLVLFGDGMHQTDDAILYCVQADTGRSLWQFSVPGRLIHLEGSPTIEGGRVYFGCGDAGVLCVELKRAVLDGKELDLDGVRAVLDQRWRDLLAKYEEDRKKDPEFAIAPTEDSLPKPSPKLLWQAGKQAWHVDAPVAVRGGLVFVASAYLDDEKVGKRALLCLKADDGSVVWETPLDLNPWAGPTLAGDLVLVGCSSIRFDQEKLREARGEVVAVSAADGQVRWRKDVPGGVLGSVAFAGGRAVFAATDGKVRAVEAATGNDRWTFECSHPLFTGPALAGGVAYVADLRAVVYAVDLRDGQRLWQLDLAAEPIVQAPGLVFGSPVVHGGRLYVGTCNLGGEAQDRPSVVACIADAAAAAAELAAVTVTVDRAGRTASIPCRIAPRKLPSLKEVYPIEVMATFAAPAGQKAHETVVNFQARPTDVHKAMEALGLKPGRPAKGDEVPAGPEVRIRLAWTEPGGAMRVVPIEKALVDTVTGRPMPALRWFFTGSNMRQPDPDKPFVFYGADLSGTLISLFPVTDETVFQSNLTMDEERLLKVETNKALLPPEGTPGTLIVEVAPEGAEVVQQPAGPARAGLALGPLPRLVESPVPPPAEPLAWPSAGWMPPLDAAHRPEGPPAPERRAILPEDDATVPPLPADPRRPRLAPPPLRPGPPAVAPSPDLMRLPALWPVPRFDPARPRTDGDPTLAAAQQALLARTAAAREAPAPPLGLTIPDPFAAVRPLELHQTPPDNDPPAAGGDLPERPKFQIPEGDRGAGAGESGAP